MKKSSILRNLIVLVAMLCCVCLAGCDLFETDKSLEGEYELVSFTIGDGTTYNVGDTYNGEEVKSDSLQLSISGEVEAVGSDGKLIPCGNGIIFSTIDEKLFGQAFYRREKSKISFTLMNDEQTAFSGKASGDNITLTFPSDYDITTAVVVKK